MLSLLAGEDGGTASATLLALAAVDPEAVAGVHGMGGAAITGVGDDAVSGAVEDVCLHVFLGGLDHGVHLAVGDGAHGAEGVDAGGEGYLAFVDVAEAGDYALVEEDYGDLVGGVGGGSVAQGLDSGFDGELVVKDVGA